MPGRDGGKRSKTDALIEAGTFNPDPGKVRDPKFRGSEFFDPHDAVQVKYEMLRRVSVDKLSVTEARSAAHPTSSRERPKLPPGASQVGR